MRGREAAEARIQKARRGTAAAASTSETDRAVAVALDRALAPTFRELPILKEKIETLNGDRRNAAGQAAIRQTRVNDALKALGDPASALAAGSTPTQAEHDALVKDVHAIFDALKALRGG